MNLSNNYTIEEARKYLSWAIKQNPSRLHELGHYSYSKKLIPMIKLLEKNGNNKDNSLIGYAYYAVGDIHDFNNAPLQAMSAYKKSLSFLPNDFATLREIGTVLNETGQYLKAKKFLEKSLMADPYDKYTMQELSCCFDNISNNKPPLYQEEDIFWQARERLAQSKFGDVLSLLNKNKEIEAAQYRACAYSGLDNCDGVLSEWESIGSRNENIRLWYPDWYFLKHTVWNSSSFWQILLKSVNNFKEGYWPLHDSLNDAIPFGKMYNKSNINKFQKNIKLFICYHIARTEENLGTSQ